MKMFRVEETKALQHTAVQEQEVAAFHQINKTKRKKKRAKVIEENENTEIGTEVNNNNVSTTTYTSPPDEPNCVISKLKKKNEKPMEVAEEEENAENDAEVVATGTCLNEPNGSESKLKDKKKRLLKEAEKADKRGVCYLSRIPPHMDHVKLRHILSQFGDVQRIFLAPEDSSAPGSTKRSRGARDQAYSEGWVEFKNKSLAKRVANMLNGEQIGGKKRSSFYYDLWNIKYLSKFKWDDLTEELALKKAIREQKIALELSAAKRERDLYLSKVDKSRALNAIEERLKKKQKIQQDSGQVAKVIRHFPQTKPITYNAKESKPGLSDDILDAVFGGS
ncbi:pre-rRNA-processing protein ESF2 isoform X2 [Arachis duranensis]|uniref:Pre-rRNA-processing protein ESF2 isoform X2 n=1 Tax=Arachis duranensis TaxID=130453 RepID=A0A6P4CE01_ARADU|nr:pre-rRNA-processing protein ESF2 isoform X2 [Arachis duranensis]XP_015949678.1 pre-rRNA-processing protein ESF2 isoform X2 [Arachis duranensis]